MYLALTVMKMQLIYFLANKCNSCIIFSEIAQVTTAYAASGTEQLSLAPGQLILILKKNASGWWQGELQVVIEEEIIVTS